MQNMSGGKTALGLDANVGAMLCYLPVCAVNLIYSIIVLVTEKDNRAVRFHAFQSLLLIGAIIVISFIIGIVGGVLGYMSTTLAVLFSLIMWIPGIAFIALAIFLCIKAYGGGIYKLPVIGDMAEKWSNS